MTHRVHRSAHLAALAALLAACSTGADPGVTETSGVDPSGPTSATPTSGLTLTTADPTAATDPTASESTTTTAGPTTDPTDSTTADPTGGDAPLCPTVFRFKPTGGLSAPRVAGEWHGFDLASAAAMSGPDGDGFFTAEIELPPGLHAYKLVVKQGGGDAWIFDPTQPRRKYVGGVENSAIKVPDCRLPGLQVTQSTATRLGPGQGAYDAELDYLPGVDGAPADPPAYEAILEHEDDKRPLTAQELLIDANGRVKLAIAGLDDGKYTVRLRAAASDGHLSEPLRLIFWIEAQPFTWDGALVYMVLTDRFRDGAPGNNPGPTPLAEPRGDWAGGDLQGLTAAIADGTLDKLGVRAIWLTPFQTNPSGAYIAGDGVHYVTGYHGYWPIKAREVDPRLGGEAALKAMVKEAHAHGIRILQDYVINHVHEEHEYVKQHPEWFRTGCVCGTQDCDWTSKALECMFAAYLPDINHSVPEANAAFTDDAIWWLDTFNLDGLRVDAVKHVEEVSTRNLAAEVREGFEAAGAARYFLMGETAMGWSDCADPCNDENYGTIARYVGPYGLDGQFDFVLYHAVAYRTFAYSEKGMLHADYWLRHGLDKWPAGAVMTPYIGSHDTPRFASLADYRGQDAQHDPGVPGNQWNNVAQKPGDDEPYERLRIGMSWLMGLPGAPLLYYGDEYGQWGGADPNNRMMWRPEGQLSPAEAATLAHVRKLGAARRDLPALQRGAYVTLDVDEDTLVFGRLLAPGDAAIVAFTRAAAPQQRSVDVNALGLKSQHTLADALGGPDVAVSVSGKINITIPAKGALVLAPK